MATPKSGNPRGRPPKRPKKNPVGRPKGEHGIMKEYRDRMLMSPKSAKVLEVIFEAALNDDHKNQSAAWKLIVERIAPLSGFEKEAGSSPRAAIQVNISGVPGVKVDAGDIIEGEVIGTGDSEPYGT